MIGGINCTNELAVEDLQKIHDMLQKEVSDVDAKWVAPSKAEYRKVLSRHVDSTKEMAEVLKKQDDNVVQCNILFSELLMKFNLAGYDEEKSDCEDLSKQIIEASTARGRKYQEMSGDGCACKKSPICSRHCPCASAGLSCGDGCRCNSETCESPFGSTRSKSYKKAKVHHPTSKVAGSESD